MVVQNPDPQARSYKTLPSQTLYCICVCICISDSFIYICVCVQIYVNICMYECMCTYTHILWYLGLPLEWLVVFNLWSVDCMYLKTTLNLTQHIWELKQKVEWGSENGKSSARLKVLKPCQIASLSKENTLKYVSQ